MDTATELGMAVTYVPDYCVDEVSDHVMALLLAWNRRIIPLDRSVRTTGWGSVPLTMRMMRLRGKKLGVVGFGRIGRAVAAKALPFGFDVLAADPFVTPKSAAESGAKLVDLETLLRESDFVTLHSPLTIETTNLIGKAQLEMMKPEAFLINAARGPLIDEAALYEALTTGQIAGAGVDVMVDAEPPPDNPLVMLDNFLVTPHVAFFSQEFFSQESTLPESSPIPTRGTRYAGREPRASIREVARVLHGEMPDNLVNPGVLSHPNPRHKIRRA